MSVVKEDIAENLRRVAAGLPEAVRLVAVSKTKPMAYIEWAYEAGQREFGENKALELRDKHQALPKDIQWHFIGHLQTNKIKYIAPFVAMIHSIDSLELLEAVDKQAQKNKRIIPCLLQFHIASEETKFGLSFAEAEDLLRSGRYAALQHVRIDGVMGMATFTDNQEQVRSEFACLKQYFDTLKSRYFAAADHFKEISMGMSEDYPLAIAAGSTLVRVGSKIFGPRVYM
ncbi:MAG: YggS family pyridoxal phosphate-dependent enzyme [Bacteroidales bacterium]|nr:YggS family pyridoxal phosphate-dependent enzyme [Bacteroidales bacterium]